MTADERLAKDQYIRSLAFFYPEQVEPQIEHWEELAWLRGDPELMDFARDCRRELLLGR